MKIVRIIYVVCLGISVNLQFGCTTHPIQSTFPIQPTFEELQGMSLIMENQKPKLVPLSKAILLRKGLTQFEVMQLLGPPEEIMSDGHWLYHVEDQKDDYELLFVNFSSAYDGGKNDNSLKNWSQGGGGSSPDVTIEVK